ncbi:MAG: hypothetical protein ACYCV0_07515 [Desulfitobacteriaceae bacterium]
MNRQELENYLKLLGQKLIAKEITGEIILAGGAVMLLVVRNRETTKDIDAYFGDQPEIRIAAQEIAREEGLLWQSTASSLGRISWIEGLHCTPGISFCHEGSGGSGFRHRGSSSLNYLHETEQF